MAKYGLQRGVRGSEARHTTTMQYYRDLKKKNETLETETRLLQEKKAEAQEELKQVKAEIRTDKLKSAATDTATALASSVGSLFGSGKMKSLERRNEDLQDRILELEYEARQRERQQAEQIQEIRNAYEQQHRKLSEFTDFVKRYFPYVEKLITLAKRGDVHSRRLATATIHNTTAVKRLFDEIAPLCAERKGGYTRIVKLGQRLTDSALVAMIEIIDLPREAAEKEEAPATTEATA